MAKILVNSVKLIIKFNKNGEKIIANIHLKVEQSNIIGNMPNSDIGSNISLMK